MAKSDTCPHCGVERPSWLGSSHFGRDNHGRYNVPRCQISNNALSIDELAQSLMLVRQAGWPVL